MSTLSTANIQSKAANTPPVIKDLNGTECGQFVRAWVVFDGYVNPLSIDDSFNVSSVTDNAAGEYTVNFTNALNSANYVAAGTAKFFTATSGHHLVLGDSSGGNAPTTTTCYIRTLYTFGSTAQDCDIVNVAFIGG